MEHKYGIGIIGYGGFGPFLHKAWCNLDGATVTAVADFDPSRNPSGTVRFHPTWQELVSDPEVSIVSISTPPSTHAEIACAAMEGGKHVLVEKPLALSVEEARRIIETRDRTGMVAGVNFMLRFNPIVEVLADWGRSGVFGRLRRAAVENYAQDDALPPDHWFWNNEVSGGILVEHAGHFIDLVAAVTCARPREVHGMRQLRNGAQEDQVLAAIVYEDDLVATHYHEFSRPKILERTSIRLGFDLAQIDIEGWIPLSGEFSALVDEARLNELKKLPGFHETGRVRLEQSRIRSAGRDYQAESMVTGEFAVAMEKLDLYADCLRRIMEDLIETIEQPGHRLRVGLEQGIESLDLALRATKSARSV